MALFNRRSKKDAVPAEAAAPDERADSSVDQTPAEAPETAPSDESVPEVGISISTFGKAPAPVTRPAAEPPAPTETVPGLADNTVLKAALAALPEKPENIDVMNVMRQSLQGHAFIRVRGDARALLAEGKELPLAVSAHGEDRYMLVFSGGAALQASIRADGDTATSAVGQPMANILRNALAGPYAGLIIDHAVPQARIVLPRALIQKALEESDPDSTIKNLLSAPRHELTAFEVTDALTRVKLWVAAGKTDEAGRIGLAEARTASGERRLEVFSHPLEVLALGRGDRPLPLTGAQLGKALASDAGLTGVIVDPAGPWIQLDREQLAPVIALAG